MKHIFEACDNIEAHMIIDLLQQSGITGHIHGEYLQGGIGELPANTMIRVAVNNEDTEFAAKIIHEWSMKEPSIIICQTQLQFKTDF